VSSSVVTLIHEQADACENQNHANKITQENFRPGIQSGAPGRHRESKSTTAEGELSQGQGPKESNILD
jgi:hypothetical protein